MHGLTVVLLWLTAACCAQEYFETRYFSDTACSSLVMQIFVTWSAPQCPAFPCISGQHSTQPVGCDSDPESQVALKAQFRIYSQEGCAGALTTMSALLRDECFPSGRNSSQMVRCAADGGVSQTIYTNSTSCEGSNTSKRVWPGQCYSQSGVSIIGSCSGSVASVFSKMHSFVPDGRAVAAETLAQVRETLKHAMTM